MRNLKRALSLLLSSTMVLGMLVMGSSAKTFTDAEDISNAEAVTIVDGLDVMNGYPDGSFKPEGIVTRAEMAVVISKMLYGPEFNPANFEGAGTFTDTPDWAEGYINLCASLNIIAGRGNGIFDPDATVTTSEAAAMFLRTLGYLQTSEEFGTDWQLAVTSKATNLGLYGDLKLSINEGLSRENVAEMAFNTLFAQRVAYDDYRGLYVKANDRNVVVTNGTEDENNTLAQNTFGLYVAEGVVVANGYTQENLMAGSSQSGYTNVVFEEAVDLDRDGKATDTNYDFEYATGIDMIGHAVSVYYRVEKKTPVVFTMVDEATLVGTVDAGRSGDISKAANALGFKKDTVMDVIGADKAILNYDEDVTVVKGDIASDATGSHIYSDEKLLLISNSGNLQVDYVIVLDQMLDKIDDIDTDDDETTYYLEQQTAIGNVLPVESVEKGDYVITTHIGNGANEDMVVAQKAILKDANITKLIGKSTASATLNGIVADGVTYPESLVDVTAGLSDTTVFQAVNRLGDATLILDLDGELMGLAETPKKDIGYSYVAQFGLIHDKSEDGLTYEDKLTALIYFADGTSEVRVVDLTNEAGATSNETADAIKTQVSTLNSTTVAGLNVKASGVKADGAYIGIYYVKENANGTVKLVDITTLSPNANANTSASDDIWYNDGIKVQGYWGNPLNDLKITKGHALQMRDGNFIFNPNNGFNSSNNRVYANSDTVFYYVDGEYGSTTDPLTVVPCVGIENAYTFTNDGVLLREYWMTLNETSARNLVKAVLVEGLELGATDVYFYNQGDFHAYEDADGKGVVDFYAYDMDGKAATLTYDGYADVAAARIAAQSKPTGFYTAGAKQLNTVWVTDGKESGTTGTIYGVGAIAQYSEIAQNLIAVLDQGTVATADDVENWGIIFDDAKVIDLTGHGINSVAKLISETKLDKNGLRNHVEIAYSFSGNTFEAGAVFVTAYETKSEAGTGVVDNGTVDANLTTVSIGGVNYRYTKAYDTIEKALANVSTYSVSDQAGNIGSVNINVNSTDGTNYYVSSTTANDAAGVKLAAGAMPAAVANNATTVTATLRAGDYIVVSVGDNTGVSDIAGFIVIEIVP